MKKIFSLFFIITFGFLIISKPVNASKEEIIFKINNNNEIITVDVSDAARITAIYDTYNKNITINKFNEDWKIYDTKVIENINKNEGDITFYASHKNLEVIIRDDEYLEEDPSVFNLNLNDIKIDFSPKYIPLYVDGVKIAEAFGRLFLYITKISSPAISGESAILNNIDKPMTLEEISDVIKLQAIDDYDGDITSLIEIESDNYSNNKNKIGNYTITYSVTNSFNLKSTFILTIVNKDVTKPIITGPSEKTYSYKETINLDKIKSLFSVSDNLDNDLEISIDNFKIDENAVKKYNFTVKATDKSNNIATKPFVLNIIDDVKPVINDEHEGIIRVNFKDRLTDEDLLLGLSAYDEICGNLTKKIKIIENNFKNEKGIHTVKYEVSDNSNNKTTLTRQYEIYSEDAPVFYISNKVLTIEDINNMSIDQLAEILADLSNIKMASYEVLEDEYSNNYNKEGTYKLALKIIDTNGIDHVVTRDINVFSKDDVSKTNKLILPIIIGSVGLLTVSFIIIIKKRK